MTDGPYRNQTRMSKETMDWILRLVVGSLLLYLVSIPFHSSVYIATALLAPGAIGTFLMIYQVSNTMEAN